MSRSRRDAAAAGLAVRELATLPVQGPVLVMEDPLADVAEAAAATGRAVTRWARRAYGGVPGSLWPAGGPYALATLRLPLAKGELSMAVHAAASVLAPGGRLWVYGANDEGIRSAGRGIEPLLGRVVTLATGGHARLLEAQRPASLTGLRVGARAWREEVAVDLPWGRQRWVSYPGVFAHGRLDPGSELLLRHLPRIGAGDRVLDYGAGTGPLAAGVLAAQPGARVTMVEWDALAAAAARENVPSASVMVGSGWSTLPEDIEGGFDLVIANPPYHRGKAETLAEVRALVEGAAGGMAPGASMRIVVQRRLPVRELLLEVDAGADVVVDAGPYRVWEARFSS